MKKLVVLGALGAVVLFWVVGMFGFRGDAVKIEERADGQIQRNKASHATMVSEVAEVAQVPGMYTEDLSKVVAAEMEGRYGKEGSQAMFQFFKERNLPFDSTLYANVQRVIEKNRERFLADQTMMVDIAREYKTLLRSNRALMYNWALGFPKVDLSKYDVIATARTDKAFETHRDEPTKLR